jgi:hypothetical protein
MNCSRCGKRFSSRASRCPHCGTAANQEAGVFQTSTVLISAGGNDVVYRSVDEVPPALRSRLMKSTNGANSATILIADRRGREEIARAVRSLPGPMQKKLIQAVMGAEGGSRLRLTRPRQIALSVVLLLAVMALVWFAFSWRG